MFIVIQFNGYIYIFMNIYIYISYISGMELLIHFQVPFSFFGLTTNPQARPRQVATAPGHTRAPQPLLHLNRYFVVETILGLWMFMAYMYNASYIYMIIIANYVYIYMYIHVRTYLMSFINQLYLQHLQLQQNSDFGIGDLTIKHSDLVQVLLLLYEMILLWYGHYNYHFFVVIQRGCQP